MPYEFEKFEGAGIDTTEMAYATPVLFAILAKLITAEDKDKQNRLYELIDEAIEMNKDATCADQIAIAGLLTKIALGGKQ
ncbi:hypothetical protein [Morganella morganii]|jgi:hypothetical protein|uniref:hypothetical protein n=1 Tax=Morganella TaxID=581 RepID=UPI001A25B503|nr:hypothetical protein [Morganella morganii]HDF2362821.1 hypothetical protein [Morganella morganii]HDF2422047.1 hypothetical protein [Morganella morganii]HED3891075.1 hypothetical protein [Morganella morganii]